MPTAKHMTQTRNESGHQIYSISKESRFGYDFSAHRSQEEAFKGLLHDIDVKSEKHVQIAHDTDDDYDHIPPVSPDILSRMHVHK